MGDLDFRSLDLWRELCEAIERFCASGPPSRRRQSVHAHELPENLRHLLATPRRVRESWREPPAQYAAGNPMGLSKEQLREAVAVRREYRLVRWGDYAGMGWVLRGDWHKRIAWLADPEGEAVLEALR